MKVSMTGKEIGIDDNTMLDKSFTIKLDDHFLIDRIVYVDWIKDNKGNLIDLFFVDPVLINEKVLNLIEN